MNKKLRKATIAVLSTALLLGQVMPGFAKTSDSETRTTTLGSVACTAIGSYRSNVASASTATPDYYAGTCTATVAAKMALELDDEGTYVAAVSNRGTHSAVQYQYNESGKVIVGCKTTHSVVVGGQSWNTTITLHNLID